MNRFMDSFDHYTTAQLAGKYERVIGPPTITSNAARTGPQGLQIGGGQQVGKQVPQYAKYFSGVGLDFFSTPGVNGNIIFSYYDLGTSTVQCQCRVYADGSIQAFKGNAVTQLGVAPAGSFPMNLNVFHYFEMGVNVTSAASGSVELRVDGTTVLNLTNVVTAQNNNFTNMVIIGDIALLGATYYVDDFYINDDTGLYNKTFAGDVTIVRVPMGASGSFTQWTPVGAATNWQAVSESPATDTKFVYDGSPGDRDTYKLSSAFGIAAPQSLQLVHRLEKDLAGTRSLQQNVRGSNGADVFSTTITLGVGYTFAVMVQETDPATGVQWGNPSAVAAAEFGQKLIT
jgi:hypothetical protein